MRVLIAAGGTAGHINPALALQVLSKRQTLLRDPLCRPQGGHGVPSGRTGGLSLPPYRDHRFPAQAVAEQHQAQHRYAVESGPLWPKAKAIMKEVKPDLVIGCGGYVSGPVVRCAAKMGIHTAIHEQNAFPGVTNKLLAPDVDLVFAAVPAAVESWAHLIRPSWWAIRCARRCSPRQRTAMPSALSWARATAR